MAESFGYAISALVMAIIFIYMILASQFKSFFAATRAHDLAAPHAHRVVLALLMFRSTLSMFSIIGVVMLMGLVTKTPSCWWTSPSAPAKSMSMTQARPCPACPCRGPAAGCARAAAPHPDDHAGHDFRHGALAFALSEGSEQRAPMGQAVIGGVITSSLLTLVVVPVVYCYMDDLARWALGKMGRGHSTSGPSKIRGLS